MSFKVAYQNLGCRVNRVEIDLIASSLEKAGIEAAEQEQADLIIVNSCAVTTEAEAKTRKVIRHAAHLAHQPQVIATGCVASLFKEELEALGPHIYVEADKSKVPALALELLGMPEGSVSDEGTISASPTPTGRTRPGIKIQDGCNNRCSFCIVWKARGEARSLKVSEIEKLAQEALDRGAQELVLTGINLGDYHIEAEDGHMLRLPELLEHLLERLPIGRIRLSSIEPPDVDKDLVDVMKRYPERIAPFLHMCLQSGSDSVLQRMNRIYDTALFRKNVEYAKSQLPMLALGTDIIVGFPGETNEEFEESLAFCEEMRFSKMHIFRYSKRPDTPAAEMEDQVDAPVMAERAKRMRELMLRLRREEAEKLIGTEDLICIQSPGKGISGGLFDAQVPKDLPVDSLQRLRIERVLPNSVLYCSQA